MEEDELLKSLEWYENHQNTYEQLARKTQDIIFELIKIEGVKFHSIENRAKSIKSFEGKLRKGVNFMPHEMQDLAGVRVITYVLSDVQKIEKILSKNFTVDEKLSQNTSSRLGRDRVGYRSIHLILSLPNKRLLLPEYSSYKKLKVEVQIRTILQHAWAQIGHEQAYKPTAILPPEIERNFMLLSGLLEIADNEFDRTSSEIKKYEKEVSVKTTKGELDILIDSISLREFFASEFGSNKKIKPIFGPNDDMVEIAVNEFKLCGISTLRELKDVIRKDYKEKLLNSKKKYLNFLGISRDIMIIADPDKYFSCAWKDKWSYGGKESIHLEYRPEALILIKKYSSSKRKKK